MLIIDSSVPRTATMTGLEDITAHEIKEGTVVRYVDRVGNVVEVLIPRGFRPKSQRKAELKVVSNG